MLKKLKQNKCAYICVKHSRFISGCLGGEKADFSNCDLSGLSLGMSDYRGVSFKNAKLTGAILSGGLYDESLLDADLSEIKADIYAVLDKSPGEVAFLLKAIEDGNIDGELYEGECCCLVGTLAKARGIHYEEIPGLKPDAGRPAERWFRAILISHKPSSHTISKITHQWVKEWLDTK